jgi:hypothetical protein
MDEPTIAELMQDAGDKSGNQEWDRYNEQDFWTEVYNGITREFTAEFPGYLPERFGDTDRFLVGPADWDALVTYVEGLNRRIDTLREGIEQSADILDRLTVILDGLTGPANK